MERKDDAIGLSVLALITALAGVLAGATHAAVLMALYLPASRARF